MDQIIVTASDVQEVIKEYIHFDCPICEAHMVATVEDGGSDMYEACGHFESFEFDNNDDEWKAKFTGSSNN